jgi:hypothetical protein
MKTLLVILGLMLVSSLASAQTQTIRPRFGDGQRWGYSVQDQPARQRAAADSAQVW